MQEIKDNLENWMKMDNEQFIDVARHIRLDNCTKLDIDYLNSRLSELGYYLELGCCGRNTIRSLPR